MQQYLVTQIISIGISSFLVYIAVFFFTKNSNGKLLKSMNSVKIRILFLIEELPNQMKTYKLLGFILLKILHGFN